MNRCSFLRVNGHAVMQRKGSDSRAFARLSPHLNGKDCKMVPTITPLLYITALNNHTFFSPQYSPEALRNGGLVLRFAMLRHQSPKLIRDRELDKRKVCRCFVGSEAVDWLTKISPMVHGRFHAIAMLQALLEEGVITQGGGLIPKNTILVTFDGTTFDGPFWEPIFFQVFRKTHFRHSL